MTDEEALKIINGYSPQSKRQIINMLLSVNISDNIDLHCPDSCILKGACREVCDKVYNDITSGGIKKERDK